jgi:hypothetical protein
MKKNHVLISLFATLSCASVFAAGYPYERIVCEEGRTYNLSNKDDSFRVGTDPYSDKPIVFHVSKALRKALLTNDKSIDDAIRSLLDKDLVDTKDKTVKMVINGNWTGFRVNYRLSVEKDGEQIASLDGCSHSPWQKGSSN